MRNEGPQAELTYRIIGCAMQVHNALGPGLKELHYHRALSVELEKAGLTYEEEKPLHVEIDGSFAGLLYADHLVNGDVIVEEKGLFAPAYRRRSCPGDNLPCGHRPSCGPAAQFRAAAARVQARPSAEEAGRVAEPHTPLPLEPASPMIRLFALHSLTIGASNGGDGGPGRRSGGDTEGGSGAS